MNRKRFSGIIFSRFIKRYENDDYYFYYVIYDSPNARAHLGRVSLRRSEKA